MSQRYAPTGSKRCRANAPDPLWVRALRPLPMLGRRARRWSATKVGPLASWFGDDDEGTAGVREPRRPLPVLPTLCVRLDEPVG